jgi:hypothetical protein
MSDSKIFKKNKMPDGYDDMFKKFAKAYISSKKN